MRSRCAWVIVPLFGLFQCNPIALPASPQIFNTCVDDTSCVNYCPERSESCSGAPATCTILTSGESACAQSVSTLPDSLVLVVNVPLGTQYPAGETLVVTREE